MHRKICSATYAEDASTLHGILPTGLKGEVNISLPFPYGNNLVFPSFILFPYTCVVVIPHAPEQLATTSYQGWQLGSVQNAREERRGLYTRTRWSKKLVRLTLRTL